MLDIKAFKKDPQFYIKELKKRGEVAGNEAESIASLFTVENKQSELEELQHLLNSESKIIPTLEGNEKKEKIKELKKLSDKIADLKTEINSAAETINEKLESLPNIPQPDVPVGKDSSDNVVIRTVGKPTKFDFKPKTQVEIGEDLDLIDTKTAGKVSGSRFAYLKNEAVMLEFALIRYAFDTILKEGFTPVLPPMLIKDEMMQGMGYLGGQGEAETYHFEKDKMYFTGTAEHSLIPMHAGDIFNVKELPKRYVGFSTAFRREAGSYGKDTKGILRLHQFDKVEMVSFTKPEDSEKEHEFLLSLSEKLVTGLELPYQILKLCTGDIANPSAKTYDIECWMPSENTYRETHSISNCTDYQSRRLKIRYKDADGTNHFVHTLNGTGFAIGRILIMILENYQQKDGSIKIPDLLQKYCGFKEIKRSTE